MGVTCQVVHFQESAAVILSCKLKVCDGESRAKPCIVAILADFAVRPEGKVVGEERDELRDRDERKCANFFFGLEMWKWEVCERMWAMIRLNLSAVTTITSTFVKEQQHKQ